MGADATGSKRKLRCRPKSYPDNVYLSGDIDLRGGNGDLGGDVMKGNVYVDGKPVCDDGWGAEEAKVVSCYLGYTGLVIRNLT